PLPGGQTSPTVNMAQRSGANRPPPGPQEPGGPTVATAGRRGSGSPSFGQAEPTLRNATWEQPLITGNPAAEKFEASKRQGKGALYVWTGRNTQTGKPEHVEFDDYQKGDLIDFKARTSGKGSIYDVSESDFRTDIVRAKVFKQKKTRRIADTQ